MNQRLLPALLLLAACNPAAPEPARAAAPRSGDGPPVMKASGAPSAGTEQRSAAPAPPSSAAAAAPAPSPEGEGDPAAKGFGDLLQARAGLLLADVDGGVRLLEGDRGRSILETGGPVITLAASAGGGQVVAVGHGVLARSRDGGASFTAGKTPDGEQLFAAAFAGEVLFLFDRRGRGFVERKAGQLTPLVLPEQAPFSAAAFSGQLGYVVGDGGLLLRTSDGGATFEPLTVPDPEPQGLLIRGSTLFVSGSDGVFRSDDRGGSFRQVHAAAGVKLYCTRMAGRGDAVLVGCGPPGHALAYSADGEHFRELHLPQAAHLNGVLLSEDGSLLAVGLRELVVRGTPASAAIVSTTAATKQWLELIGDHRKQRADAAAAPPPTAASSREPPRREPPVGEPKVVRGRVLDGTGAPVAGQEVRLVGSWAIHGEGFQKTATGPDGSFRFQPTSVGSARISVERGGFAPIHEVVAVDELGELALELVFLQELPLDGSVLTPEGTPAKGWLKLRTPAPPGEDPVKWMNSHASPSASLDAAGGFSFKGLRAGEYQLELQAEGFQPTTVPVTVPTRGLRLVARRGATLSISATGPGGAATPTPHVSLRPGEALERELAATGAQLLGFHQGDEAGVVTIAGLPDGLFEAEVSTPGRGAEHSCVVRPVEVRGGVVAPLAVRFGVGPVLTGVVREADGGPAEGLRVMATPGKGSLLCGLRIAVTAEDGTFSFADVDPTTPYEVIAFVEHWLSKSEQISVKVAAGQTSVAIALP